MDICHLKNAELEADHLKYKGREVILWNMILETMKYSPNKDQQLLKWQQQKSWLAYPDCQDEQDNQLMQYLLLPS